MKRPPHLNPLPRGGEEVLCRREGEGTCGMLWMVSVTEGGAEA